MTVSWQRSRLRLVVNHRAGPSQEGWGGRKESQISNQERVSKCFPETSGSKKCDHVFPPTVDWGRPESKGTQQNQPLISLEELCHKD